MAELFTADMFSSLQTDLISAAKVILPIVFGIVGFRKVVSFAKREVKTA